MSEPAPQPVPPPDGPALAVVALGSNLGDPVGNVRAAISRLRGLAAGDWRCSSLWRTTPVDCPDGSPAFINAVVAFRAGPEKTPETLLGQLQEIEREFGRRPKRVLNEARPLDLDLIAFGAAVRSSPQLTLPHPRALRRRFVLAPLAEILPRLVLPGEEWTVAWHLARLESGEVIERMEEV